MICRPSVVLLVEDDAVVRTSLRFALETAELQVEEAGCIASAERCFRPASTDIAIIDVHLPDGCGCQLVPRLRCRKRNLAVVLISTDPDDPELEGPGMAIPPDCIVLAKPFSSGALLDAISREVARVESTRGQD